MRNVNKGEEQKKKKHFEAKTRGNEFYVARNWLVFLSFFLRYNKKKKLFDAPCIFRKIFPRIEFYSSSEEKHRGMEILSKRVSRIILKLFTVNN